MDQDNKPAFGLFKQLFQYVWNQKNKVFLLVFIGGIIGFTYAFLSKPKYQAKLVFLLNESKAGSINPLSALAGQLGLSQVSPSISEDRILFLASTKNILGSALLSEFEPGVRIGDTLMGILHMREGILKDTSLVSFTNFKAHTIEEMSFAENKIMDDLINHILISKKLVVETYKKKVSSFVGTQNNGILIVSFEDKHEMLSLKLTHAIYDRLSEFYTKAVTKSLQANYDLLDRREDSLRQVLTEVEVETASAIDDSYQVIRYKGKIREGRLKRELEILNIMYAEVIKNKELAKFNLEQERPVFQLIDEPMLPLEKHEKSKLLFTSLGAIGFGLMALFLVIGVFIKDNFRFLS